MALKIAVYTIALDEAAHVDRWADSAVDADHRIVGDTGSSDDTVERLLNKGVTVHRIGIRPWRFDDARNAVMSLIPGDVDVCVTMDMDVFLAPGWRPKVEAAWTPGTTALYIRMILRPSVEDLRSDGVPSRVAIIAGTIASSVLHEALSSAARARSCATATIVVMYHVQDDPQGSICL